MRSAQDAVAGAAFAPRVIVIVGTAVTADIAQAADEAADDLDSFPTAVAAQSYLRYRSQRLHPKNYIHAGHPSENICNTIHRMVSQNLSIHSIFLMLLLLLFGVVVVAVVVVAQMYDCRG